MSSCQLVDSCVYIGTKSCIAHFFNYKSPGQKSKDEDARVAGGGARGGGEFVSLRMLDAAPLHVDTLEFVQVANSEPTHIYSVVRRRKRPTNT